ncbi:MAG: thiolase domain-containing protein [Candidatus Thorarchaeota archaeon]|nr:thiolase domain-containing protein [Candidatus Thorarchaeota archaeon]
MDPVNIIGVGMTKFGVLDDSILDLAQQAAFQAIDDSSTTEVPFEYLAVGVQNPDEFVGRGHFSTLLADTLGIVPAGAIRVETGPSSGSSAFESAFALIASGMADLVLVVGVEKMSEVDRGVASKILAKMMSYENETRYGATPAALAAMITRRYMHDYGLTRNELSLLPVKAHRNGAKNPLAHFRKEITVETVNNSRIVADPLTLFDCCPTSDGAASIVVASDRIVKKYGLLDRTIRVAGIGHGTDYLAVQHRLALTSMNATVTAAQRAFKMADVQPRDVGVCELHDAFSILELIDMEDVGLVERGTAIDAVKAGNTEVSGDMPVNPSGGLKARGHPTGATGVAQIRDIVLQLRGEAPKGLQVDNPRYGLTQNIGGFGNNMVVAIFSSL